MLRLGVVVVATAAVCMPSEAGGQTLDFDPPGAPAIGDFTPVTLTGGRQLSSLSIAPFTVTDATLSLAGWHVVLTVPDLVNGASMIPASAILMDAPVVTAVGGADITGVAGHPATGNLAAGENIVTADAGSGDGSYLVSPSFATLEIPVTAIAGTYASAASMSVVSGP